jgi:hypothetical protein
MPVLYGLLCAKIPFGGYTKHPSFLSSLRKKDNMIKQFALVFALMLMMVPFSVQAQKTGKKPVKTKTTVRKKKTVAPKPVERIAEILEEPIMSMDGDKSLYMGQTGDKLVYEVNAGGQVYDFIITIQQPKSDAYRYSFDWEMTAPVNKSGHVNISKTAAYDSKKYMNYFKGGDLNLTDACTVWMTGENFGEMPDKKTTMQFDSNEPETFYRKDEAETEQAIKYKGKEIKLDIFKVDNDKEGGDHRQVWIQGISAFPLIVKMDLGWTIRLKEIK